LRRFFRILKIYKTYETPRKMHREILRPEVEVQLRFRVIQDLRSPENDRLEMEDQPQISFELGEKIAVELQIAAAIAEEGTAGIHQGAVATHF